MMQAVMQKEEARSLASKYRDAMCALLEMHFELRKECNMEVSETDVLAIQMLSKMTDEDPLRLLRMCESMPDLICATAALVSKRRHETNSKCEELMERFFDIIATSSNTAVAFNQLYEAGKESDDASATEEGTTGHPASAE